MLYGTGDMSAGRHEETKSLIIELLPEMRCALGEFDASYMRLHLTYANALGEDVCATRDDVAEATTILEGLSSKARRVFGPAHPLTMDIQQNLTAANEQ